MSYPEPRYLGDGGEASATFRPSDAPPDISYQSGGTADYLATGTSTGGLFGLYRWNMSAEPSGPGPHYHRTMAESFYVLVGTVKIYDGTDWLDCRYRSKRGGDEHVDDEGVAASQPDSAAVAGRRRSIAGHRRLRDPPSCSGYS